MANKAFSNGLHRAAPRRQIEQLSGVGTDGRTIPEPGSLSLQVTVYANVLGHTVANEENMLGEVDRHSSQSVLLFAGTVPVDLKLMPNASADTVEPTQLTVQQNHLPLPTHTVKGAEDPWCDLEQSARYLGISTSTLYKYSSQRKIESRKIAGRLQFRRSELDEFLEKQIRPARKGRISPGIISTALCSGK
jgi:excisionase family DNA binding protein